MKALGVKGGLVHCILYNNKDLLGYLFVYKCIYLFVAHWFI